MISYELAKKLKEAEFPQTGKSHTWYSPTGEYQINPISVVVNDSISIPTLSELIEACGKDFSILYNNLRDDEMGWWAGTNVKGIQNPIMGKTPEIAVANLWLAINKK